MKRGELLRSSDFEREDGSTPTFGAPTAEECPECGLKHEGPEKMYAAEHDAWPRHF